MASYFDDHGAEEKPEQRAERRLNIPIPVRVRGRRVDGTEFDEETITVDASASGMSVFLPQPLRKGDQVHVTAPEEGFESSATVWEVIPLGPNMKHVRLRFPSSKKFDRSAAPKKYVYDYVGDQFIGYIIEGIYYNTKHEAFAKVEAHRIVSLATGEVLFTIEGDRVLNPRRIPVGHLV